MRERPDDKRVVKTIRTIHAAFEQMMCEMDYRDITVKELCERALVNTKTCYRYSETMDFLLAEFPENMMTEDLARVAGLRIPDDLEAITREFFAFATE
ncbi:MAG: TetR/AcrR family transcriptional regulator, partial [Eggerthellaceae bacterium]|nr:TetR/AcrR family transcriptional regulator [Eggerthellaceae bacterium]